MAGEKQTRLQVVPHKQSPKCADTLREVEKQIGAYACFQPPEMHLLPAALYVVLTHCFDPCFNVVPYLMVSAEDIVCGKTVVLDAMASLSYPAQFITEMSAATMFEYTHHHRGSLYLDEFEDYRRDKEALGIFNGGYKRGACVTRKRGKEWVKFNIYAPKAFGLIGLLYPSLMSRCICFFLERETPLEEWTPTDWNTENPNNPLTVALREELHDLVNSKLDEIKKTADEFASNHPLLTFLKYRERELWKPLFVLCKVLAPNRIQELTDIATFLTQRKQSRSFQVGISSKEAREASFHDAIRKSLLVDIFTIMGERIRIRTAELMPTLLTYPMWQAYEDSKGQRIDLTDAGLQLLARLLKPIGVEPKVMKFEADPSFKGGTARGYERQQILEAMKRLGIPLSPENPVTAQPVPPPPAATPVDEEPPSVVIPADSTPVLPQNPVTPKQGEGYEVTGSPLPPTSLLEWRARIAKWSADRRGCFIPLVGDNKRVTGFSYNTATRGYDFATADGGVGTMALKPNGMTEVVFTIGGETTTYQIEWIGE
jgi:hypothetical protein